MKKIIVVLTLFISSICIADSESWVDPWCKGIELCAERDFVNATLQFSYALEELQKENNDSHPEIHVDRGQAYLLLDRYGEALADFDQAMNATQPLSSKDLLLAIEGRLTAYANLGRETEWAQELDRYRKFSQEYPKIEKFKDRMIIRNVPDCEIFQRFITNFLLKSKMIEDENSIRKYPSKIWIIKAKPHFKNGEEEFSLPAQQEVQQQNEDAIVSCRNWCDRVRDSGLIWCQAFGSTQCQTACASVVEILRNECISCCNQGGVYTVCVLPFEDILQAMEDRGFNCIPDIND